MLSYKLIDLLKLGVKDFDILYNNEYLEIKSPIITYEYEKDNVYLIINSNSHIHNTFVNMCSYIDRLFNVNEIPSNNVKDGNIKILIDKFSVIYSENKKIITNIKRTGKIICSFNCVNGNFVLKKMLFVK